METRALIEVLDRDGQVRQQLRVHDWPVRIGRALDADLVLDDPHVAAWHAWLGPVGEDAAPLGLTPEATVNGVRLGRRRLPDQQPCPVRDGQVFQLGASLVRVRLAAASLRPELPLPAGQDGTGLSGRQMLALAGAGLAWVGLDKWIDATPGTPLSGLLGGVLAVPLAFALWCGLWALGSKLFQRHFAFWAHLEVALVWVLVAALTVSLGPQLAFAFSAPWIAALGHLATQVTLVVMVWKHLGLLLPAHRRLAGGVMALAMALMIGVDVNGRVHAEQPLTGDLYLSTLAPPALRVAKARPAEAFVEAARRLEVPLQKRARENGEDSEAEAGAESEDE